MIKWLLCFFILLTGCLRGIAQQDRIWVFGNHAGLDFTPGSPLVMSPTSIEGFGEANASVCDASGQLLFYTEGSYIWDKNGSIMPNGSDLTGFPWYMNIISPTSSTAQGTIIIPMPDSLNKYYVFSLTSHELAQNAGRLYYSIVDMNLNGGLGDVVTGQKGIYLDSGFTESMTAALGDECNLWLLLRTKNGRAFKSYEIAAAGINPVPVTSAVGDSIGPDDLGFRMAVSPDRAKMATGKTLYDFDALSGTVANPVKLLPNTVTNDSVTYGVCFSPDNSRLYVNTLSASLVSRIYQFDLNAGSPSAISASAVFLGHPLSITDLKLAPDGKIYFFTIGGDLGNPPITTLGRIDLPNASGTACQYVTNALQLNLNSAGIHGLPNIVCVFKRDTLYNNQSITTACFSNGLTLNTAPGGRGFLWSNGGTDSTLEVTVSGSYFVSYHTPPCTFHLDSFQITIPTLMPTIGFRAPVCKYDTNGMAWVQPAGGDTNNYTYTWQDEAGMVLQHSTHALTGDTLFHLSHGHYHVRMESRNGCDTIFSFYMPPPDYEASFNADTLLCMGDELPFHNTSTSGAFSAYRWLFGDGEGSVVENPEHRYLHAGMYEAFLIAQTDYPCYDTAFKTIIVDSMLAGTFQTDPDSICMGRTIRFLPQTDSTTTTLHWQWGDGTEMSGPNERVFRHAYDSAGALQVQLTAQFRACPDTSFTGTVYVYALPKVNLGPDSSLCLDGSPIRLHNQEPESPTAHHYLWNTGDTTASLRVVHPGTYSLTISNEPLGCSTTETVEITKDCYIDIPNAFTPNGDGENDYFFPRQVLSSSLNRFRMQVLNRWGQVVFETMTTDGRGWDGSFNGKPQPQGVYIYLVDADFVNGRKESYKGNVTLLR